MEEKISLLIPFSSKDPIRIKAFTWLMDYWRNELPDCEIVVGESKSLVFCKEEALNNAVEKSVGDILVILDADVYLDGKVITHCAERIREELKYGCHLWYVPYRNLYRLVKNITEMVLASDPKNPLKMPSPPPPDFVEGRGEKSQYGNRFGAMITIFPRKAYDTLGCFDERFIGWGGEDVCLLRALDTLFGKHKTTDTPIYHLWHPAIGQTVEARMWDGQASPNSNKWLSVRYNNAKRNPTPMRTLLNEANDYKNKKL